MYGIFWDAFQHITWKKSKTVWVTATSIWDGIPHTYTYILHTLGNTGEKLGRALRNTLVETFGETLDEILSETFDNTLGRIFSETPCETLGKTIGEIVSKILSVTFSNAVDRILNETFCETPSETLGETLGNTLGGILSDFWRDCKTLGGTFDEIIIQTFDNTLGGRSNLVVSS